MDPSHYREIEAFLRASAIYEEHPELAEAVGELVYFVNQELATEHEGLRIECSLRPEGHRSVLTVELEQ